MGGAFRKILKTVIVYKDLFQMTNSMSNDRRNCPNQLIVTSVPSWVKKHASAANFKTTKYGYDIRRIG